MALDGISWVRSGTVETALRATLPLMIFWSFVVVGVLAKRRGRALRNPDQLRARSNLNHCSQFVSPCCQRSSSNPLSRIKSAIFSARFLGSMRLRWPARSSTIRSINLRGLTSAGGEYPGGRSDLTTAGATDDRLIHTCRVETDVPGALVPLHKDYDSFVGCVLVLAGSG